MGEAALRLGIAITWLVACAAHAESAPQIVRPTERPFLYRIEGTPPSYLYGTIHVPDDRVLALPTSVRLALQRADVLATELELNAQTQRVLQEGLTLPVGQSLSDVIPAELHSRLARYLASKSLDIAAFERIKLVPLAAQLEVLDYLHAQRPALDQYLVKLASQANKQLTALETAEEQITALDALSLAEQVEVVGEELERLEKLAPGEPGPVEKMVRAYVAGDEKALWAESMAYVDLANPIHAKFIDALFTKRNVRLAERIDARLAAQPRRAHFAAIGALHLFGPDGVITRLEKLGHTLVRIEGNATP